MTTKINIWLCSALCVSFLGACSGRVQQDDLAAEVEKNLLPTTIIAGEPGLELKDRMAYYKVPGVSVAVINNKGLLWTKHFGIADVRSGQAVTDDTVFNVGSMSKAVTSAVILTLVQDGLVDLDAPINTQLKSWKLPENEFTHQAEVTPRRLMNHSGGVVYAPGVAYAEENLPTLAQLLDGKPPSRTGAIRVDRVPGSSFQYSNPGYVVLRQLAEDVTGQGFAEVASQRIFEPVGMRRTSFVTPLPPELLTWAAMGHRNDGTVDAKVRRWCGHMAAGGLWTTATDYAAFVIELQKALRGEPSRILDRELVELMINPHDADEYGLGIFLRESKGERRYVGHIGDGPGFVGGYSTDINGEYGVVVLTNGQGGINLVREIRRAVASVYDWPDNLSPAVVAMNPTDETIARVAGRYRYGFDQVLTIDIDEGGLRLSLPGSTPLQLLAVDEQTFVCRERSGEITFEASEGERTRLVYHLSDDIGRLSDTTRTLSQMHEGEKTPLEILLGGDFESAVDLYMVQRDSDPKAQAVSENRLNRLGYQYLGQNQAEQAVLIFRLNAALYPNSGNVFDSLGEGLLAVGDREKALSCYQRSLALDPTNVNAARVIEEMQRSV